MSSMALAPSSKGVEDEWADLRIPTFADELDIIDYDTNLQAFSRGCSWADLSGSRHDVVKVLCGALPA